MGPVRALQSTSMYQCRVLLATGNAAFTGAWAPSNPALDETPGLGRIAAGTE